MYEGYERVQGSSGGVAEEIIGKALKGRRNHVVLATKVGMCVGDLPEDKGTGPAAIRKHLELSLKRLDTDVIDIYYLHNPDPGTPLIETLAERIAGEILLLDGIISTVIRVRKPHVPMNGLLDYVEIEITRSNNK